MMKLILASSVVALLATGSMSVMAGEKHSADDNCKAMAKKDHVADDKMEAFMKTCVEKHAKKAPAVSAAPAAAPAPATAAEPAAAPAPATASH